MNLLVKGALLTATLLISSDISMLGLKIGNDKSSLDKIKLKLVSNSGGMYKYQTKNGNDFSITFDKGKIVYMENDWQQDPKASQPLFSDFQFGQTTLNDIRKKMGTNGFTYKDRQAFTTDKDLIEFNCFQFNSPRNEILVTVTKVALTTNVTETTVADYLKLDAIIIADPGYCDKLWGKEKVYDKNFRKVDP
jgi:hypothetical protein